MAETHPIEQNFANHTKGLPLPFIAAGLALAVNLLWALWILFRYPSLGSAIAVLTAAALIVIMSGAIVKVHGANGFFLDKLGFEYCFALIGLLLPILICGPGRFSIGQFFLPKSTQTGRPIIVVE